ncbi:MAG: hypothetical protein AAF841_06785 [Pseudomonadota bacterium]
MTWTSASFGGHAITEGEILPAFDAIGPMKRTRGRDAELCRVKRLDLFGDMIGSGLSAGWKI